MLFVNLDWKNEITDGDGEDILIKMDSARSWFHRFHPRGDKLKSGQSKKNETGNEKDGQKPPIDEAPSTITKQKVAAAKQYIENHYKAQMKCLQDRKERYLFFNSLFYVFYWIDLKKF